MKISFIIFCHFPSHYSHAPELTSRSPPAPFWNILVPIAAFSASCGGKRGFTDCTRATFPPVIWYTYSVPGKFPNIYGKLCVVMFVGTWLRTRLLTRARYGGQRRGCSNLGTAAVPVSFGAWLRTAGRDWTDYNDQEWHQNIIWSCPGTTDCSRCYNWTWKANFAGTFWIIINTKDRGNGVFDSAF